MEAAYRTLGVSSLYSQGAGSSWEIMAALQQDGI